MTGQSILVIGGGFLGCALAHALSAKNYRVTILSPRTEPSKRQGQPAIVRGGQEDGRLVAELLREHNTVIHTAWGTTPGSSAGQPTLETAAGLAPWVAFLDTLQQFPSVRLVFLSSGGTVYGGPEQLPVAEDYPLRPLSCHGAGKAAAELFLATLTPTRLAGSTVLRPSNVYGPEQPLRGGFGVLRHLLQCAINGRSFTLWGDGSQVRDYLYVDDFVDAVLRVLERPNVLGVYNIGSGTGASLLELIALVENVTARRIQVESQPPRAGDVAQIVLDIGKFHGATGWMPTTSLSEGIARTWRWLRENA